MLTNPFSWKVFFMDILMFGINLVNGLVTGQTQGRSCWGDDHYGCQPGIGRPMCHTGQTLNDAGFLVVTEDDLWHWRPRIDEGLK